ncbi:MAG: OmpA family protein [Pseudomonadota bacterium]|nr:OmpA family protein [Pseudomonadota bacterium]
MLVLFIGGCSSVPDSVNPVEWYKGAKGLISGKSNSESSRKSVQSGLVSDKAKIGLGRDKGFPTLQSVPERPERSTSAQRAKATRSLLSAGDKTRRYSDEVLRRQGQPSNAEPVISQLATSGSSPAPQTNVASKKGGVIESKANNLVANPYQDRGSKGSSIPQNAVASTRLKEQASGQLTGAKNKNNSENTLVVSGDGLVRDGYKTDPYGYHENTRRSSNKLISSLDSLTGKPEYQVATIYFGNGSAKLKSRDKKILKLVAAKHKEMGGVIRVVGHASSRTQNLQPVKRKLVNFGVSAARADVVVKELIRLGASAENVFVSAVSDTKPMYREYMPFGEAGNRRTEIFLQF